jgi:hypothetical protein
MRMLHLNLTRYIAWNGWVVMNTEEEVSTKIKMPRRAGMQFQVQRNGHNPRHEAGLYASKRNTEQ